MRSLGVLTHTVIGNLVLHLLAVAAGGAKTKKRDTLQDILRAPDREQLLAWLRTRPLLHHDPALGFTVIHAGLLPQWDITDAQRLAREAEAMIADPTGEFFSHMYGDLPDRWQEDLRGVERLRVVINAFTRLRYCDVDGRMDLHHTGAPGTQPPELMPWFQVPGRRSRAQRIVFGHWSALGAYCADDVIGLDSGCVWGRALTAVRLDRELTQLFDVPCSAENA